MSSGRLRRDEPAGAAGSLRGLQPQTCTLALLRGCRGLCSLAVPHLGPKPQEQAWPGPSCPDIRGKEPEGTGGSHARQSGQGSCSGFTGRADHPWEGPATAQGREHVKTSVLPVGEGLCGSRCYHSLHFLIKDGSAKHRDMYSFKWYPFYLHLWCLNVRQSIQICSSGGGRAKKRT